MPFRTVCSPELEAIYTLPEDHNKRSSKRSNFLGEPLQDREEVRR